MSTSDDALALVVKYGPELQALWTSQPGMPSAYAATAIATDPSGTLYVAGNTEGALVGHTDVFVAKYAPGGAP